MRGNETEFTERVRKESAVQYDEAAKAHRKRIAKNEKRIAELDMLFRKTYEDNAVGKLSVNASSSYPALMSGKRRS